ncbi:ABC transporter permease [Chondromyces apiculatus]|uniref:Macrolide export ATP-binding/permease protein MacB n=1 Tax=Chondromyces apiculatus DSM 436 TaxID=1192034 RepID=A0A017TIQ7_9BACT|nr:ABC transporter permease [Chondromyces apiculatus]EYF08496.1 Macrolide export ATP-binding/permease protein MacB [Chondromyces apiculatus DSM 436]
MWWATILMALREIRRHTMRSVLTGLGVVIGVGAVIMMVTVGSGATQKVTSDVASMGNNMLTVMPGAMRRGPSSTPAKPFKREDADAIKRESNAVKDVAPTAQGGALAVFGNRNHTTSIYGSTESFFVIRNLTIAKGRAFTASEIQGAVPVCVLGETVRKELFGAQEAIGTSIRLGQLSCTVVGTIASKGQSTFGQDQDDLIVMPLTAYQRRIAGNSDVSSIVVSAKNDRSTTRAKMQIEGLLRERRRVAPGKDADFSVMDMKELSQALSSVTGTLTALLGAIAGVSLLVGGIGIMNIMLVSVTERTREIGIRLAIGALANEVLLQFLVEAVVLSMLGGILGVALGLSGSFAATRAFGLPFVVSPAIVIIAVTFSGTIGVAFGFLPARKAARLNPIDALRHE